MPTMIIGISGTNGAGKDTVGHMLADKFGYIFISVTEQLRNEARKRGLPPDRESLHTISADWRRDYGLSVLIDKAVEQYKTQSAKNNGLVMASLRNPAEAERVHELGGVVLWLDGDPRVRYDRVQANAAARNRTEEDNKDFEQFLAEESMEMHSSGDAATLNMAAVKELSDFVIINNSNDLAALEDEIKKALQL